MSHVNILTTVIKNRFRITQYPSFVTFFVTWRCNCKCIMCDIWKKRQVEELSIQEIENIFKQLKPIDAIRLSGGEPFLRKDISRIINVVDVTVDPKIIHITTNGLLTDYIVSTIKELDLNVVKKIHIKISIDDIGKAHDEIRGVAGVYDKAMDTVEKLAKLREDLHFYLGVDQTIVSEEGISAYSKLKSILEKINVNIHPVIAYEKTTALYSDKADVVLPSNSYKTYGNFPKEHLKEFIQFLIKEASFLNSFEERVVKKYYLKGLYNRLIENKERPSPACVALNNHLRILPNGDIPVCMYNSTIIGNLRKDKFKDIWFGENIKKYRQWTKQCKGCWAGCETNISAVYSGDIWKAF